MYPTDLDHARSRAALLRSEVRASRLARRSGKPTSRLRIGLGRLLLAAAAALLGTSAEESRRLVTP